MIKNKTDAERKWEFTMTK